MAGFNANFEAIIRNYIPTDYDFGKVDVLSPSSSKYYSLKCEVSEVGNVTNINENKDSYSYLQFLLKKEEYQQMYGQCQVKTLYHDTSDGNSYRIMEENFNYRLSNRVKYGKGVSFSPSVTYANKESNRSNGVKRCMIATEVLICNTYPVSSTLILPPKGFDTTVGNCGNVYVKYYDCEFFPKYFVYYDNTKEYRPYRRRW